MLLIPKNTYGYQFSSTNATRIGVGWGTIITASATINTKGAFTSIIAAANVPCEIFIIQIRISAGAATTAASNGLLDIGIDTAGGTNFTTVIPNLSCAHPPPAASLGVIEYIFPLYIPQGASIGARQQNTTASNTCAVGISIYGRPRRPDIVNVGHEVIAYGASTATSLGTAITPGVAATKGAWTQLGTSTTDHWWWQMGMTVNDPTMSALSLAADLSVGTATLKEIVFEDLGFFTSAGEQWWVSGASMMHGGGSLITPSGTNIYGRLTCSGNTPDTGYGLIAYGLS